MFFRDFRLSKPRLPGLSLSVFAVALAMSLPVAAQTAAVQEIGKLLKQGQHAQALEQVDKYLVAKPLDAEGRFLKGLILTEMNKIGEATAIFQKLTEDYPELPEPFNNLAVIYAQQKQYDKAKQALEMAIRTHPSYATAHENLGDVYTRLASQAYDKALQIDSSNTSAQTKLSMIRDLVTATSGKGAPPATAGKAGKTIALAAVEPKAMPASKSAPAKAVETKATEATDKATDKTTDKVMDKASDKASASVANPDIAQAVKGWAAAWSRKDVKAYLGHYARDFKTPSGMSRAQWETERTQRVGKPGAISVGVENLRIAMDGENRATARFAQHYKSATLSSSTGKTLTLVQQGGKWLILQERVGN